MKTEVGDKYISKPVEIRAIQWTGSNIYELVEFLGIRFIDSFMWVNDEYFKIKTLEGWMLVSPGDYIIKGLRGEFYPCKPDVFNIKYRKAEITYEKR